MTTIVIRAIFRDVFSPIIIGNTRERRSIVWLIINRTIVSTRFIIKTIFVIFEITCTFQVATIFITFRRIVIAIEFLIVRTLSIISGTPLRFQIEYFTIIISKIVQLDFRSVYGSILFINFMKRMIVAKRFI